MRRKIDEDLIELHTFEGNIDCECVCFAFGCESHAVVRHERWTRGNMILRKLCNACAAATIEMVRRSATRTKRRKVRVLQPFVHRVDTRLPNDRDMAMKPDWDRPIGGFFP